MKISEKRWSTPKFRNQYFNLLVNSDSVSNKNPSHPNLCPCPVKKIREAKKQRALSSFPGSTARQGCDNLDIAKQWDNNGITITYWCLVGNGWEWGLLG